MKRSMRTMFSPQENVLSSEGRRQACLYYAESRKTTNVRE